MIKYFTSKTISYLIVFICIYLTFNHGIPVIYKWDTFAHYIYLPQLFDQGTFAFKEYTYFEAINKEYFISPTIYQFVKMENGNIMTKCTIGFSILHLPFYLIAELWALLANFKTDGFSYPYQVLLALGSTFYFVLGVHFFRKLLLSFFTDKLTSVLLVLCLLGTNYFFNHFASLGSSNNIEFALLSLFLFLTVRFYQNANLKIGILLGITCALIVLVRPPDIIFALILVFWKRNKEESFKNKFLYYWNEHKKVLFSIAIPFLFLVSIQMVYWKLISGSVLLNSYANNPGEGFDWFQPYFSEILFSFKKGWFIYTPMMLFACVGFYFLVKNNLNGKLFFLTFVLFFYVISCWTTWWYAASFSQRALIDALPVLGIALGYFLLAINNFKFKWIFFILLFLCFVLNVFQTYQVNNGILHLHRMTKSYYFSIFGQINGPDEKQTKLLSFDRDEVFLTNKIDYKNFYKTIEKSYVFEKNTEVNDKLIYAPKVAYEHLSLSKKSFYWLKVKWKYEGTKENLRGNIFNMCAMFKNQAYGWQAFQIGDTTVSCNDSLQEISFNYLTPHFRTKADLIHFGLWHQSGNELKIKSVHFEVYEPYRDLE